MFGSYYEAIKILDDLRTKLKIKACSDSYNDIVVNAETDIQIKLITDVIKMFIDALAIEEQKFAEAMEKLTDISENSEEETTSDGQ